MPNHNDFKGYFVRWLSQLTLALFFPSVAVAQTFTVLHAFSTPAVTGTNEDGSNPGSGVILFGNVLCATTANGGRFGAGVTFSVNLDGTDFDAFCAFTNSPDVGNPRADLVSSGNTFFGAASGGGINGTGAIFSGRTNSTVSVICSFTPLNPDNATNATGANPADSIVLSAGILYGAAAAGGAFANGVLFSVATNGPTASILHSFTPLDPPTGTNSDGAAPWGNLVLSGSLLFGTTSAGGAGGNGTIFSVNANGSNFTTLYHFTAMDPLIGTNTDGAVPVAGLILSNGVLYGTTMAGGLGKSGTIFSIRTSGTGFTVLHHFTPIEAATRTNADGANPVASMILSGDTLFGTASAGGVGATGVIFSVKTNGTEFKTLYHFTTTTSGTATNIDGAFPVADLLLSGNLLYGTAFGGGSGGAGTIYSLSLPLPQTPSGLHVISDFP